MRFDAHTHVFELDLPMREGRRYTPSRPARADDLLARMDEQGVEAALLVQPSFLRDPDHLFDVAAAHPRRFEVVVAPATVAELTDSWTRWRDRGMVGVRLNLVGATTPRLDRDEWQQVGSEMARTGVHLEVHATGSQWDTLIPELARWPSAVVIDHLGRTEHVAPLAELGAREHVWFKVSAPYRWPSPTAADRLLATVLERTGGHRLLWGSDWPFTQHEDEETYPSIADAFRRRHPDLVGLVDRNIERLLGGHTA